MSENEAVNFIEKHQGQKFLYTGDNAWARGKTGTFQILEDMNCCAPTNSVLFAFVLEKSRVVLSTEEFGEFIKFCKEA